MSHNIQPGGNWSIGSLSRNFMKAAHTAIDAFGKASHYIRTRPGQFIREEINGTPELKEFLESTGLQQRWDRKRQLKEKWKKDDLLSGTMHGSFSDTLRSTGKLLQPYWGTKEAFRGWWYLGSAIALAVLALEISFETTNLNSAVVGLMQRAGTIKPELTAEKAEAVTKFIGATAAWFVATGALVGANVYNELQRTKLQIDWWMSMMENLETKWLNLKTHLRLQTIYKSTDNPQQRITRDTKDFTDYTTKIPMDMLNATLNVVGFTGMLWAMSSQVSLVIGGHDYSWGPGWLAQATVAWVLMGTALTHAAGHKLPSAYKREQMYETNYENRLARIQENSKTIASFQGEKAEQADLKIMRQDMKDNAIGIMNIEKGLGLIQHFYKEGGDLFPFLIGGLAVANSQIPYGGGLVEGAASFIAVRIAMGRVERGLSIFAFMYDFFAKWKASADRLLTHCNSVDTAQEDYLRNLRTDENDQDPPASQPPSAPKPS